MSHEHFFPDRGLESGSMLDTLAISLHMLQLFLGFKSNLYAVGCNLRLRIYLDACFQGFGSIENELFRLNFDIHCRVVQPGLFVHIFHLSCLDFI